MSPLEEFHRAPPAKVTSQMERSSKESMKTAILKQEATFRQQVHELHRLYRVQKQLMSNAKSTQQNLERRYGQRDEGRPRGTSDLDEQESDLELTLATGCRRKRGENALCKSDSGTSFSSSSSESGSGSKPTGHDHRLLRVPDLQSRARSETKSSFDSEDENRKGRIQPPWMLPCLSLKMSS